ncbi:LPXTG-domain-containing protein, partial [Streptococcus urinalis FB127-CNA-2]
TSDSTSNSGSSSESDSTSASSSESSSQVFVSSESTSQTPHKGSTSLPRTGDDHSASMAAGLGIGLVGLGLTVAKRKTNKSE